MKKTVNTFKKMKQEGEKITVLTAYEYAFAKIIDEENIDMTLVGDSLGMVVQGEKNTLGVTLEDIIYHTKIVSKISKQSFIVADMPFMSYQVSIEEAVFNAGRLIKEGGAEAVKLEGGIEFKDEIKAIVRAGIPVQAHIGLMPQSVHKVGGYKVQKDEKKILEDAIAVEEAGAFSVVLEGIPADIAKKVTNKLSIPTIGIGAGVSCDGQVLVINDMIGLNEDYLPKFVKKYAQIGDETRKAVKSYIKEVKGSKFPQKKHCY